MISYIYIFLFPFARSPLTQPHPILYGYHSIQQVFQIRSLLVFLIKPLHLSALPSSVPVLNLARNLSARFTAKASSAQGTTVLYMTGYLEGKGGELDSGVLYIHKRLEAFHVCLSNLSPGVLQGMAETIRQAGRCRR
jgi:hypothetical protein